MARTLVTGGTGFVGSHVARALAEDGHQVRVLHRQTSKLKALDGVPFESVTGGLTDLDALRRACEGVDWVFHVAAIADYWRADHRAMYHTNVEGTRYILQAARETGVRRVVFTSSAAAVGLRDDKLADENQPFNMPPGSFPYGHSKWLAEQVVKEAVESGQDAVIVNPVAVMGPGDLNLISGDFVVQIKRYGLFVPITSGGIAVTDVRDVARWHLAAVREGVTGERYLLGTANYSYRDWFTMIAETVGAPRPRFALPDVVTVAAADLIEYARKLNIPTTVDSAQARLGVQRVYFDYRKAWAAFGPPQLDMARSLRDTYGWYVQHGYM